MSHVISKMKRLIQAARVMQEVATSGYITMLALTLHNYVAMKAEW